MSSLLHRRRHSAHGRAIAKQKPAVGEQNEEKQIAGERLPERTHREQTELVQQQGSRGKAAGNPQNGCDPERHTKCQA